MRYQGATNSQLGEGQFVGTLDLQADVLSELDVVTRTATRVMCWCRKTLAAFTAQRPGVKLALELQRILGTTLAKLPSGKPTVR